MAQTVIGSGKGMRQKLLTQLHLVFIGTAVFLQDSHCLLEAGYEYILRDIAEQLLSPIPVKS